MISYSIRCMDVFVKFSFWMVVGVPPAILTPDALLYDQNIWILNIVELKLIFERLILDWRIVVRLEIIENCDRTFTFTKLKKVRARTSYIQRLVLVCQNAPLKPIIAAMCGISHEIWQ